MVHLRIPHRTMPSTPYRGAPRHKRDVDIVCVKDRTPTHGTKIKNGCLATLRKRCRFPYSPSLEDKGKTKAIYTEQGKIEEMYIPRAGSTLPSPPRPPLPHARPLCPAGRSGPPRWLLIEHCPNEGGLRVETFRCSSAWSLLGEPGLCTW